MLGPAYILQSRLKQYSCSAFGLGGMSLKFGTRHYSEVRIALQGPPASVQVKGSTQLVFVSSKEWDKSSHIGMKAFAAKFAERGYHTLLIDIGPPNLVEGGSPWLDEVPRQSMLYLHLMSMAQRRDVTSEELMDHFDRQLASNLQLMAPNSLSVVFARASGCFIAQRFISSHPAAGMFLISPPTRKAASPSPWYPPLPQEFIFGFQVPCGIFCTEKDAARLSEENNRLWNEPGVDKIVVEDKRLLNGRRDEGLVKIEEWLNKVGI